MVNEFSHEKSKLSASISWIVSKAFPPQTPKPEIYNLIFDANTECQLTHHVIRGLTSNNLYSAACSSLFPNSRQETWTDHDCILRNLRRRGIPVLDEKGCQITQTVLQRDEGGNLHKAHLALIDGLMIAYTEECASCQQVEAAIARFCTRSPSPQVPKATPEALDLWVREANAAALKGLPVPSDRNLDASSRLALLINFYAPDLLPVTTVDLNSNLSWQRKVDNWNRVRDFCASYLTDNPFVAHPADVVRSADRIRLNITCLTAELFRHLELSGKFKPSYQIYRTYPALQQAGASATPPRRLSIPTSTSGGSATAVAIVSADDSPDEGDYATPESEDTAGLGFNSANAETTLDGASGDAGEDDEQQMYAAYPDAEPEEEEVSIASEARSDDSKTTWLDYARKTAQRNTMGDLAARGINKQQQHPQQQQQSTAASNLDLKIRLEMKKRQIEMEKRKLASQSKREREEKQREIFMQLVQRQAAGSAGGSSGGGASSAHTSSGSGSGTSSVKEADAAYSDRLEQLNSSLTSLQDEIKQLSLQQERVNRGSIGRLPDQQSLQPKPTTLQQQHQNHQAQLLPSQLMQQQQLQPSKPRATWKRPEQMHQQQKDPNQRSAPTSVLATFPNQNQTKQKAHSQMQMLSFQQPQQQPAVPISLPMSNMATSSDAAFGGGGGFRLSPVENAGPSLLGTPSRRRQPQQQPPPPLDSSYRMTQSSQSSDLTQVSLANSHGTVILDRPLTDAYSALARELVRSQSPPPTVPLNLVQSNPQQLYEKAHHLTKAQRHQQHAQQQQQSKSGFFLAGEAPEPVDDPRNVRINKNNFFVSFDDDEGGAGSSSGGGSGSNTLTPAGVASPRRAKRKPQLSSSLRVSAAKNGAAAAVIADVSSEATAATSAVVNTAQPVPGLTGVAPYQTASTNNSRSSTASVIASASSSTSQKAPAAAEEPPSASPSLNARIRKSPVMQSTAFSVIDGTLDIERVTRVKELQLKQAARLAELAQKRAERERIEEEKAARKTLEREEAERKKAEDRRRRDEIFRQYMERKQQEADEEGGGGSGSGAGFGFGYGGGGSHSRSVSAKSTIRRPKSMFIAGASSSSGAAGSASTAAGASGGQPLPVKKSPSSTDLAEAAETAASLPTSASAAVGLSHRTGSVVHLTAQDPNVRLFVKPKSKTNKHVINNAISHCCLAGIVNEPVKKKALADLDGSEISHFMILFRDAKCQYRGLYGFIPESEVLIRLSGRGPRDIDHSMVECFFKYNSGSKKFSEIKSTKHLSPAIDAVCIQDRFWKQQGRSASTTRK